MNRQSSYHIFQKKSISLVHCHTTNHATAAAAMCSEQPKENMLDIHITHGNSMYQSLPKLISLSEHFLEDHTCIVLFLYLATKHIYIYIWQLALLRGDTLQSDEGANSVRCIRTHTYVHRYIFVENF
jgi:hypothetical protein